MLFGAGASYGCGAAACPPLGDQLFDILVAEFPRSWGSIRHEHAEVFRSEGFETGLAQLWHPETDADSTLLLDLAHYFSRFEVVEGDGNLYSRVVRAVVGCKLARYTTFATLNYDCMLDLAVNDGGLQISYLGNPPPRGNATLLKLHGSCHFVAGMREVSMVNCSLGASDYLIEAPVEPLCDLRALRRRFEAGESVPPVMSLYAAGKRSPVTPGFLTPIWMAWRERVRRADIVVAVGVRPVFDDTHVWGPLLESRARLWYVGGTAGTDGHVLNGSFGGRLSVLGSRFDEATPLLERRLRSLV